MSHDIYVRLVTPRETTRKPIPESEISGINLPTEANSFIQSLGPYSFIHLLQWALYYIQHSIDNPNFAIFMVKAVTWIKLENARDDTVVEEIMMMLAFYISKFQVHYRTNSQVDADLSQEIFPCDLLLNTLGWFCARYSYNSNVGQVFISQIIMSQKNPRTIAKQLSERYFLILRPAEAKAMYMFFGADEEAIIRNCPIFNLKIRVGLTLMALEQFTDRGEFSPSAIAMKSYHRNEFYQFEVSKECCLTRMNELKQLHKLVLWLLPRVGINWKDLKHSLLYKANHHLFTP